VIVLDKDHLTGTGDWRYILAFDCRNGLLASVFQYAAEGVSLKHLSARKLVLNQAIWGMDDPHCCPSRHVELAYRWNALRHRYIRMSSNSGTVYAHAQAAQPSFDVASVRPSQHEVGPDYNNQIAYSPDGFTGRNVTLKRLIAEAWHCQLDQVQGPPWISHNEYDISTRIPEGASREQVALMLRSLLSDRFHLKVHSETRPMRVYELTTSPKGLKIHPTAPGTTANPAPGLHFHGDMRHFADLLALQFSMPAASDPGTPVRAAGPQIPVLDKTGLKGTYDFSVDMRPELGTDGFTAWKRALQDQLGLNVESRKSDVEIIVVDDALKIPTAN
jgi:uncharacterized protein (TIGR03435 family)